jgi:hypothetical protein
VRVFLFLALAAQCVSASGALRFRVTLDPKLSAKPVSGRMLVFLSDAGARRDRLSAGFVPGATWVAAMEVEHLAPGASVEFDPDRKAYPRPFSQAPAGDWQAMALLDPDHSYARTRQNKGDLYSEVIEIKALNPAAAEPVLLALTRHTEGRAAPADTPNLKLVEYESPRLSAFWGRAITMRAGVVLPPGYDEETGRRYPACYVVHGFGGNHLDAWREGPVWVEQVRRGERLAMVRVYWTVPFPAAITSSPTRSTTGPGAAR